MQPGMLALAMSLLLAVLVALPALLGLCRPFRLCLTPSLSTQLRTDFWLLYLTSRNNLKRSPPRGAEYLLNVQRCSQYCWGSVDLSVDCLKL